MRPHIRSVCRGLWLATLFTACQRPDPTPAQIPLCGTPDGTPPPAPAVWNVLPTIPTTAPSFRETEKVKRATFQTGVFDDVTTGRTYRYVVIADATDRLNHPTDVALNPLRPGEIWVSNYGQPLSAVATERSFTLTVFQPGTSEQFAILRKDKGRFSRHFFSYPTALAFNKDGYWANTSFVNNGSNGPTLWTSDFSIYADSSRYTYNGSHSSMLHESPVSLGIAADEHNTFWVLDGTFGDVVGYHFGKGHYPGGDDHTDGIIRRYALPDKITSSGELPSHVCYDAASRWLYVVDATRQRIVRLKTDAGTAQEALKSVDKAKEYTAMTAPTEVFLDQLNLTQPCGIETDGKTLYVSDYATGRIALYDLATRQRSGLIDTRQPGIAGLLVEPGRYVWYVNMQQNTLVRVAL